jgi:alpha-tubulin suppressor-like RCC1 family protein
VSAGRIHTCAVQRQGKVWCWGANSSGQLGAGSLADSSTFPLEVQTITDVTYISAGGYHTCAVESSGMLWCWGYNRTGQLGDTTYTNRFTPAKVIGLGLEAGTSD